MRVGNMCVCVCGVRVYVHTYNLSPSLPPSLWRGGGACPYALSIFTQHRTKSMRSTQENIHHLHATFLYMLVVQHVRTSFSNMACAAGQSSVQYLKVCASSCRFFCASTSNIPAIFPYSCLTTGARGPSRFRNKPHCGLLRPIGQLAAAVWSASKRPPLHTFGQPPF